MLENETLNRSFQACMAPLCMVVKQLFEVVLVLVIARIDSLLFRKLIYNLDSNKSFFWRKLITMLFPVRGTWEFCSGVFFYIETTHYV